VARYGGDFRHRQAQFKEPADSFMPKIVEPQVFDAARLVALTQASLTALAVVGNTMSEV